MKRQFNISADFTNRPAHSYTRKQYNSGISYHFWNIINVYKKDPKYNHNSHEPVYYIC